jgi:TRAP-type mannitol/chloroaromatic compound transport system substrate-binding protein
MDVPRTSATVCVWLRRSFDIRPFTADELVLPCKRSCVTRIVEVGHDFPLLKDKLSLCGFASVPFGMDAEGITSGSMKRRTFEMMQELYGRFNLYALPGVRSGRRWDCFL